MSDRNRADVNAETIMHNAKAFSGSVKKGEDSIHLVAAALMSINMTLEDIAKSLERIERGY